MLAVFFFVLLMATVKLTAILQNRIRNFFFLVPTVAMTKSFNQVSILGVDGISIFSRYIRCCQMYSVRYRQFEVNGIPPALEITA